MKVRHIKIGIKSWEENKQDLARVFRGLGKRKRPPAEETLYFQDVATFRRCLPARRLELLWAIAEKRPHSVSQLAAAVRREAKSVEADVDYLASVGLVEFRAGGARGNLKTLVVPYDRVDLSLELRGKAA